MKRRLERDAHLVDIRRRPLLAEAWPNQVARFFDSAGVRTWGDLEAISELAVLKHRGIGRFGLNKIKDAMHARGLVLKTGHARVVPIKQARLPMNTCHRCGVYFIWCAGRIKIGYASNVRTRFKSIENQTPFECELLGMIPCSSKASACALEKELHNKFDDLWIYGEWFHDSDPLSDFIANLPASTAW